MDIQPANDAQKRAILDVISMLKITFGIKDDDAVVIGQQFTDKQREVDKKIEDLQRREREFSANMLMRAQQTKQQQNDLRKQQLENKQQLTELSQKIQALSSQEKFVVQKLEEFKNLEHQFQQKENELITKLENVANLSKDEAINLLCQKFENDAKIKIDKKIKDLVNEANSIAHEQAIKILTFAIQKESTIVASQLSVSNVDLPNDSLKGKIIGREGRNIKCFEELTGVTVLIDDTPEMVVLSCYDPVRREIAKIAMSKLIADGRIHPQRIEEVIEISKKEFEDQITTIGKNTAIKFGITDFNNSIIENIGKLKYRTSYSQNILQHSEEVASICRDIAAELKLNVKLATRVGLLHDIGKATDRIVTGSHAEIGADFALKCSESNEVCQIIREHHNNEITSIYTWIVKAADTLSSARVGARLDSFDTYIKRLQDLEQIATSFPGVKSSYAMLAGRELRVVVEPNEVTDTDAENIAENIKDKIEKTMTYPGEIKVTVIREKRHIKIAT